MRSALSWILFIRLLSFLLQNIHTIGQYPNCELINAFIIVRFWWSIIKRATLIRACSFCVALLHQLVTCSSKDSLLSIFIPSSFSQLLLCILNCWIWMKFSLLGSLNIRWNLSGLAFSLLLSNHVSRVLEYSWSYLITDSISLQHEKGELSSA